MGNQICVKLHTRPGTEVVLEQRSHIFNYEMGASAALSGVTFRAVAGADGPVETQLFDLAADPRFTTPAGRLAAADCLDEAVSRWSRPRWTPQRAPACPPPARARSLITGLSRPGQN